MLADTRPALRSFCQLLIMILSSIFSTQLQIIFSSPLRGAFSGRRPFLAFQSYNIHLCRFSSYVFSSSSLLYKTLVIIFFLIETSERYFAFLGPRAIGSVAEHVASSSGDNLKFNFGDHNLTLNREPQN